ncbi:MAG TPA: tRNA epoxyqueuosine(34) reductase QueG, partial [Clostridium sp.]|nr:tRNA epoxyqueuosine(34) reductase QueG [Clostridium sp.]
IFLGEIITDLSLEIDIPVKESCRKCELCLNACPTNALKEQVKDNDFNRCLSYLTQKKHIDEYWFDKFKGKIFGCDICQDICPYNKEAKLSHIEEFKAF